jgi:protocatechuate 3,4-dioxygenase beta subunit
MREVTLVKINICVLAMFLFLILSASVAGVRGNGINISGIVVGEEGKPVTGAEVGMLYGSKTEMQRTDDKGNFNISIEFYAHETFKYVCAWDENTGNSGYAEVEKGHDEKHEIKIVLLPSAAIKGRVVDEEGKGIPGTCINTLLCDREMGMIVVIEG